MVNCVQHGQPLASTKAPLVTGAMIFQEGLPVWNRHKNPAFPSFSDETCQTTAVWPPEVIATGFSCSSGHIWTQADREQSFINCLIHPFRLLANQLLLSHELPTSSSRSISIPGGKTLVFQSLGNRIVRVEETQKKAWSNNCQIPVCGIMMWGFKLSDVLDMFRLVC